MLEVSVDQNINKYWLDLDAAPSCDAKRFTIDRHIKQGNVLWSSKRLMPYRTRLQQRGYSGINGRRILRTLNRFDAMPILNANALDFLLEHQDLIPMFCRNIELHFWGTIYRETKGDRFVRYLHWNEKWIEGDTLVDGYGWSSQSVAALYIGMHW